jgi:hypothetical protein
MTQPGTDVIIFNKRFFKKMAFVCSKQC